MRESIKYTVKSAQNGGLVSDSVAVKGILTRGINSGKAKGKKNVFG